MREQERERGSVFKPLKSRLTASISKTVSRSVTCQLELNIISTTAVSKLM